MIVECNYCEARVDGRLIAKHISYDPDTDPDSFYAYLLECPRCKSTLLAGKYKCEEGNPTRLWPRPDTIISGSIPEIIRSSIEEATKCFKVGAYSACAVMCGRSLEGICRNYGTKQKYLGAGLRELKDNGVIDKRLYQWAEELQKARNISAHATGEKISKEDARDLLDFVNAICEYVFVLTEKFNEFTRRKNKARTQKKGAARVATEGILSKKEESEGVTT